jgi:hypothetical protein
MSQGAFKITEEFETPGEFHPDLLSLKEHLLHQVDNGAIKKYANLAQIIMGQIILESGWWSNEAAKKAGNPGAIKFTPILSKICDKSIQLVDSFGVKDKYFYCRGSEYLRLYIALLNLPRYASHVIFIRDPDRFLWFIIYMGYCTQISGLSTIPGESRHDYQSRVADEYLSRVKRIIKSDKFSRLWYVKEVQDPEGQLIEQMPEWGRLYFDDEEYSPLRGIAR